jgi:hypothetical protein
MPLQGRASGRHHLTSPLLPRCLEGNDGWHRFIVHDAVAFTGEGRLVRRHLATNTRTEAARSGTGFAGYANRASGRHSNVSVTHGFL